MDRPDRFLNLVVDGRYRLTRYLGAGSFGSVYAADEETLGRVVSQVAVKIIRPADEKDRQSVLNEILGLASLHHDYIINYRSSGEIRDGELAGSIFLATELGDITLHRFLKSGERMSEEELRELALGLARALTHVHSEGHAHGDVKPGNIIRVKGRWKLGDLGLVRSIDERLTGPLFGSLTYAAPEMLRNKFGPAADVYALAVTVLFALTGRRAHTGETREQFIDNLRRVPPKVPRALREPWRTLLENCLRREPENRWVAGQMERYLEGAAQMVTGWIRAKEFLSADALIVAQDGSGDHTSVIAAVSAAAPGDRIVIKPGRYRDTIRIDKSLEIIGDGPVDDIVVAPHDARCVEIATDDPVLVRGLFLRCRPAEAGVECYAVDIGRGRPVFEHCRIRSRGADAVAVHDQAVVIFRRCTLFGSGNSGAFVFDGGQATFEECILGQNDGAGVTIGEGGQATLLRCEIRENQGGGAFVYERGQGMFEECKMIGNSRAGVAVGGGGHCGLANCQVRNNHGEAVWLHDRASASVAHCDLTGNDKGAWHAPAGCKLQRKDNQE
jgi:hypothetical protein